MLCLQFQSSKKSGQYVVHNDKQKLKTDFLHGIELSNIPYIIFLAIRLTFNLITVFIAVGNRN